MPQIVSKGGPPALGNQSFAIGIQNAPAGNLSALFIGIQTSFSIFGCTLVSLPGITVNFIVGPDLPFRIPCTQSLVGNQIVLQWIILDAGGPQGISMSDGLLIGF